MPRGKTEATKLREAIKTERRYRMAYATVELEIAQKQIRAHSKKPLTESLREHIGKALDRVDPLEAIAILGTTYLIKSGIQWSEEFLKQPEGLAIILSPISAAIAALFAQPGEAASAEWTKIVKETVDTPQVELLEWILSFTAAFFLVRSGKEISGNIIGAAKGLLLGVI